MGAGICDDNESSLQTCHREVLEETGLTLLNDPELLFSYYPSPGGSNELIHLFFRPAMRREFVVIEANLESTKTSKSI